MLSILQQAPQVPPTRSLRVGGRGNNKPKPLKYNLHGSRGYLFPTMQPDNTFPERAALAAWTPKGPD